MGAMKTESSLNLAFSFKRRKKENEEKGMK